MKKSFKNILSAAALLMLTATSAFADSEKGVEAKKSVKDNGDGTYTLTLETWADGETVTTTTKVRQSMDVVLVLDRSSSMVTSNYSTGVKRLDAMKSACESFVTAIKTDADKNKLDHKIAVVTYGSRDDARYTKEVLGLTGVKTGSNTLINTINAIDTPDSSPWQFTCQDQGLQIAQGVISSSPAKDENGIARSKVVVLLTDGQPTEGTTQTESSWSETVVKGSIESTNALKAAGVTVFVIDISSESDVDVDADDSGAGSLAKSVQYLDHLSSDYSSVGYERTENRFLFFRWYTYSFSGTKVKKGYYKSATQDLNNAFTEVANESTSGSSETQLTDTNSSVRDYITPQFRLTGKTGSIRTKVISVDPSYKGDNVDNAWGSEVSSTGINVDITEPDSDGISSVVVTGFNFKENFVGPKKKNGSITGWTGAKLVIEIDIEQNGNNDGGVINTNTPDSGIYSGDGQEADFNSTGIEFPVPQYVEKGFAYLHIVKSGLADGTGNKPVESAIFDIKVAGKVINTVMVNGENPEAYVKVDWLTDAAKARTIDSANPLTLADMVKFTVVERADWSWNAPDPASISSELYDINDAGSAIPYTFEFGVGDPKTTVAHDEESAVIKK